MTMAASFTDPWRLQTSLDLAALPTAVPCARAHVRAVAAEWGRADLADTAELAVSELVTNAIRASDRLKIHADQAIVPVVRISISRDGEALVIRVWDGCDEMPIRQETGAGGDGGRGLMIIDALCKDWGVYRDADGKVVWATVTEAIPMTPARAARLVPWRSMGEESALAGAGRSSYLPVNRPHHGEAAKLLGLEGKWS